MNYRSIKKLQKIYGANEIQDQINSGLVWKLEGSVGRFATSLLELGICILPLEDKKDSYGNTVPSRRKLKNGTKGTYQNAVNFWMKVWEGDDETISILEVNFGNNN